MNIIFHPTLPFWHHIAIFVVASSSFAMACYSGFPGVFALRGSSGVATLLLLTLATAVPVSGSACVARFFRCRNQIPCGRFRLCAIMIDCIAAPIWVIAFPVSALSWLFVVRDDFCSFECIVLKISRINWYLLIHDMS